MIKTYRKKTLTRAVQYDGTNGDEVWDFCADTRLTTDWGFCERKDFGPEHGNEGDAVVYDYMHKTWIPLWIGDYIAEGPKGENYPINGDVMTATYVEVSDQEDE